MCELYICRKCNRVHKSICRGKKSKIYLKHLDYASEATKNALWKLSFKNNWNKESIKQDKQRDIKKLSNYDLIDINIIVSYFYDFITKKYDYLSDDYNLYYIFDKEAKNESYKCIKEMLDINGFKCIKITHDKNKLLKIYK